MSSITFLFLTFYLPGHVYSYYFEPRNQGSEIPVRLKIPKINVNALINPVGVDANGSMATPVGREDVGWFMFGPRPGETGSAVIDGHYGFWENGKSAVFNDLNKLKRGDEVYVEDKKGNIIIFIVRKIAIYNPNENASNVFALNDGIAHLNLITCEGTWIKAQKTYSNRLVVFTDKK